MIRIKDFIYNENEIQYIMQDDKELHIVFKNGDDIYVEGTFEDIEWNYGSQEQCYNEETEQLIASLQNKNYKLQDRIKQLEEEHKELVETNYDLAIKKTKLEEELNELKSTTKYTYDITV